MYHKRFPFHKTRVLVLLVLHTVLLGWGSAGKAQQPIAPVLLGGYPSNSPWLGDDNGVETQFRDWDKWAGKRMSIGGTFYDLEFPTPAYNLTIQLRRLHEKGYTPFVNLGSHYYSALLIAQGAADADILNVAKAYAAWVKEGPGRKAFLAPLPEMNNPKTTDATNPYGGDPDNFKKAYAQIQKIFADAGVGSDAVWWVFAPNGWSGDAADRFENYYPEAARVDVVGFSAYNFGHYKYNGKNVPKWEEPDKLFRDYIQRMRDMAEGKPIFITQTGTTCQRVEGRNQTIVQRPEEKRKWLRAAYQYWATCGVRGVLYFNYDKQSKESPTERDWAIFRSTVPSADYQEAVAQSLAKSSVFDYVSPAELIRTGVAP